jgi:hypothetical protein
MKIFFCGGWHGIQKELDIEHYCWRKVRYLDRGRVTAATSWFILA